jgi:hypothetical protein
MGRKDLKIQLALVFVFLGSLGMGCSSSSTTSNGGNGGSSTTSNGGNGGSTTVSTPSAFGAKYAFANNAISGWQQETGSDPYAYWTGAGTDLNALIDGGSEDYTSRGCLLAMYQTLVGPDPQSCRVVAMDFGTEANATDMFTYEQQHTSASIPIPSYDTSVAVAYSVISGITVYAHIKAAYFELQLTGYSDNATATQVATQFLDILKAKTN